MKRTLISASCAIFIFGTACAREVTTWRASRGLVSYFHYSRHVRLAAAHRTLPIGSQIRVFNLDNGRSAVVTVVGRGPFIRGRVIDVSLEAADALGFRREGVAHVRIESIGSLRKVKRLLSSS
jgi:rare lipoprotein A